MEKQELEHRDTIPEIDYFNSVFCKTQTESDVSTPLEINVIVLCIHLSSRIRIALFYDTWEKNEHKGIIYCKYDPSSKKSSKKKVQTFYNCVTLSFFYKSKKISAKIFPTGKVVISGCRTIETCHEIVDILFKYIYDHFLIQNDISESSEDLFLEKVRFCNLNTQFKFKFFIRQSVIQKIIKEKSWKNGGVWRNAIFDGNKYAAVKAYFWPERTREFQTKKYEMYISSSKHKKPFKVYSDKKKKVPGQVSVMIFRTGTIMLKGARNVEDLYSAYRAIHELAKEVYAHIKYDSDSDAY